MAKSSDKSSEGRVTRIKASDNASSKKIKPVKQKADAKKLSEVEDTSKPGSRNPFRAIAGYFKGAWYELRQVRWPDRRTTWSMTGALLAFTVFFVVVIILLDMGFQRAFNLLIGT